MNTHLPTNRNFLRLTITTFLVCLAIASFIYESSNMTGAMRTLQNGEPMIAFTHIISILYIAIISTALLMVLHHFGRLLLNFQSLNLMKNADKKDPVPELVIVNPQTTRDLLSNIYISKN